MQTVHHCAAKSAPFKDLVFTLILFPPSAGIEDFKVPSEAVSWGFVQAKYFYPTVKDTQSLLHFLRTEEQILTDLTLGEVGGRIYSPAVTRNLCSARFHGFFISCACSQSSSVSGTQPEQD